MAEEAHGYNPTLRHNPCFDNIRGADYICYDEPNIYIMLNSCAQSAQKQAAIVRKIS